MHTSTKNTTPKWLLMLKIILNKELCNILKLPDKNHNSHGRESDTEISGRVRLICCDFYAAHVSTLRNSLFRYNI